MKRVIQKKILNELSKQNLSRTRFGMLPGKVLPKSKVLLNVFDGHLLSRTRFGMVFRTPREMEAVELLSGTFSPGKNIE